MTLLIELTAASSDLPSYLAAYDANFSYNGNGWFFRSFSTGQDQWSAGVDTEGVDNNTPSVIMGIDDRRACSTATSLRSRSAGTSNMMQARICGCRMKSSSSPT